MRLITFILMAVIIGGAAVTFMRLQRPDLYYGLMAGLHIETQQVDSDAERQRIDYIRLLPISDEKKQYLSQHTIFNGASTSMVELALGDPRQKNATQATDGHSNIKWIYLLHGDSRPTVLLFEDDKLTSAYRTSAYSNAFEPPVEPGAPTIGTADAAPTPRGR